MNTNLHSKEVDDLKALGFVGFRPITELTLNTAIIPNIQGVYCVLYSQDDEPDFVEPGCGGHFKGKDPNVSKAVLQQSWVSTSNIIYIGKAGGAGKKASLRSRLSQYFRFGQGKNIGHWGGRFIWQIEHSDQLTICWKQLTDEDARSVEGHMIEEFVLKHGRRPFANLAP
jgi:hypothetical protein